jgi:hypothetical protein
MVRLDLIGLYHMRMVTQAIKQLWPVGLRIDRLEFDAFDESLLFRAFSLGLDVQAPGTLPASRHAAEGAKILQRIDVEIRRLGVDVFRKFAHAHPREWIIGFGACIVAQVWSASMFLAGGQFNSANPRPARGRRKV